MVTCERYQASSEFEWDDFVAQSKTPMFFFSRKYMEYHSDRFVDCSLMFRQEGALLAVFPASILDGVISSHGGLTYGGLLLSPKVKVEAVLEILEALLLYAKSLSVSRILYKSIPHIFAIQPAEEDLYALFRSGARLCRRDFSSVIQLNARMKISKGRKWLIARAKKNQLQVTRSSDWERFHDLLESTLGKHGVAPVHSAAELRLLAQQFPDNMVLNVVEVNTQLVAAILLFKFNNAVHTQYIASTEEGREAGALDHLIETCIQDAQQENYPYFSFGISTENQGQYLNGGLAAQKESFGARGMAIDFYEMTIE